MLDSQSRNCHCPFPFSDVTSVSTFSCTSTHCVPLPIGLRPTSIIVHTDAPMSSTVFFQSSSVGTRRGSRCIKKRSVPYGRVSPRRRPGSSEWAEGRLYSKTTKPGRFSSLAICTCCDTCSGSRPGAVARIPGCSRQLRRQLSIASPCRAGGTGRRLYCSSGATPGSGG